jgi:hypothetical protein
LAFSGEFMLSRKHTRWIGRDLPVLMGRAVDKVLANAKVETDRLDKWRAAEISPELADSLIVRAAEAGIIPSSEILKVRQELIAPHHREFEPRTAWGLYNAFTERFKPRAETEGGEIKLPAASVERIWRRSPRLIPLIESAIN